MARTRRSKPLPDALFPVADGRVAPRVAPLVCSGCGAPVPLGEGDVARCPHCAATVDVPEPLRQLRAAARERTADRATAEALYRRIGSPPSVILRAWASAATAVGGVLGGVAVLLLAVGGLAAFLLLFLLELALHALAPSLRIDLVDVLGGGNAYAAFGAAVFVLLLFPISLTSYLQSFLALRRTLQANLAAVPPSTTGGAATCRDCGGALDVLSGALGVRCLYCGADNLVALEPSFVRTVRSSEKRFHAGIGDAVRQEQKLRAEGRSQLRSLGIVGLVVVPLLWLAGTAAVFIDNDMKSPPSWRASHRGARTLMQPQESDRYRIPDIVMGQLVPVDFAPDECDRHSCTRSYELALSHGEVLFLTSPDLGGSVTVAVRNTTTFPFIAKRTELAWKPVRSGDYAAVFAAPYTGSFHIEYSVTGIHRHDQTRLQWIALTPEEVEARAGLPARPASLLVSDAATPPRAPILDEKARAIVEERSRHATVRAVAVCAARPELLITGEGHLLRLWWVPDGSSRGQLEDTHDVQALALRSDGALLASASAGADITLYDLPQKLGGSGWRETLTGHTAQVTALAFCPGSSLLASGAADGSVFLWDADSGRRRFALDAESAPITALGFSPDGRTLTVATATGARAWHAPTASAWSRPQ